MRTVIGNLDMYLATPLDASGDEQWIGVGFGLDDTKMGIAEFYTGQSDTGTVTNRWIGEVENTFPSAKETSNVIDSKCVCVWAH